MKYPLTSLTPTLCLANTLFIVFTSNAEVTIRPIPGLGGSRIAVFDVSQKGFITGSADLQGNSSSHAFLYASGASFDLGSLGGSLSFGYAVNDLGQVAGESLVSFLGFDSHAIFHNGTTLVDLDPFGDYYFSSALDVNDAGQVVGFTTTWDWQTVAFIYDNGTMRPLLEFQDGPSYALAINQQGVVMGTIGARAFVYSGGTALDLGTLGGSSSVPRALNNMNAVAGDSVTTENETHGFLWRDGVMVDLGTLGGSYSTAFAINDQGQVIGISTTAAGESHGFIYASGGLLDLGTLGGATCSPSALNNLSHVVGTSTTQSGGSRPFLWRAGNIIDLNFLLPPETSWELTTAEFITDEGLIVGQGTLNGTPRWYVLQLGIGNTPPVAVAAATVTGECGSPITIDGSQSFDPDGETLAYEWSVSGTVVGNEAELTRAFSLGVSSVVLKVTDVSGDSSEAIVEVQIVDSTAPVCSGPASVSVAADSNCRATVPDLLASFTVLDACATADLLQIVQNPAPGTQLPSGEHVVTVSVADPSGNTTRCAVAIMIEDRQAPTIINAFATPSVLNPPNRQRALVSVTVNAADNCDAAPGSRIVRITSNEAIALDDARITGELTAQLVADRNPGSDGRVYVLHIECTDASGNVSTSSVQVVVPRGREHAEGEGERTQGGGNRKNYP